MITRKEKRELEKDKNYFFEFIKIKNHFFKELDDRLKKVKDHRHQSYIRYETDILLLMVLLKNICSLKSMNKMTNGFNKDECIENIKTVLEVDDLEEIPHYDTINDFLSELKTEELESIRTYMIKELLKKRSFDDYRLEKKYWCIIFDGTGLFKFNERHCEHCLKRVYNKGTEKERTVYMHHVLEAKLLIGGMVLSIGSEFIENESEDVEKQDCEMRAFHRLAEKIKNTYKRLPICILADSLYACEPVFERCGKYGWAYLLSFKEGSIKSVALEFEKIKGIEKTEQLPVDKTDPDGNKLCWVNDISYNNRTVNMLEFNTEVEVKKDGKKELEKRTYLYITNIRITKRKAMELLDFGRRRWKIENEGFNNQKNIRYDIEHANSHNYNAIKNHYLLTQLADIMMQLYENGSKIFKVLKKAAHAISKDLLEALRREIITDDMLRNVKPMQVRFCFE